ncbi:outer membrane protein with glycine zipper [Humitalea rosea]|uniref:Outer membrane protein with glycine zipper n=1 Tax=Humitalea rosea TaxID=990373 RepID=A0A2W7J2D0_9PROT|nr:YMGG-like glycine zipper-containing protein [Humitalea rosea]PZW45137.1 outer membrane protein with glycine zipper [Humitalea rosea]
MPRPLYRATALLTASLLLTGCVTTRAGRIGADDGTDACRTQVVALDSTGNFFAEDILRGAAVGALAGAAIGGLASGNWRGALLGAAIGGAGGAAVGYFSAVQRQAGDQAAVTAQVGSDLEKENIELVRTQVAFDQLMDCRYRSAQTIRQAVLEGRVDRPTGLARMAEIRGRAQRDIALAQQINTQIGTRGAEFDTAIDNVVPGGKASLAGALVGRAQPIRATARRAVPVKLSPTGASVEIAQLSPREVVQVSPASGGYALVETSSGLRGYAPVEALQTPTRLPDATPTAASDVRSLAATNVARRDNFAQTVGNAERLAQSGGFELTAG